MCRIAGIYSPNQKIDQASLIKMRDSMSNGGPDAEGVWINEGIGLAHRRLSIIDLNESSNQPFHWNHYVLCFNGEIYNYREIRDELISLGYKLSTQSDTEVLVVSFHHWGIKALKKFHGMFAFALWDKKNKALWLSRDRIGVKPLYLYKKNGLFLWSSELKGILAFPNIDRKIDRLALSEYMHFGYIPSPKSIFVYVRKVLPGTIIRIDQSGDIKTHTYWSAKKIYEENDSISGKDSRIQELLEEKLIKSFNYRMVADVPVGVFLSGGIDSSLVAAILSRSSSQKIHSYTIGFNEKELDEAPYAQKIAEHLGTEHTEMYCSTQDVQNMIGSYFQMYDEPFGDSSGIPTYMVSYLAKQHVKVALSADGADELFGGYTKYVYSQKYYEKYSKIPNPIRLGLSRLITSGIPLVTSPVIRHLSGIDNLANKLIKGARALKASNIDEFFHQASGYMQTQLMEKYKLSNERPLSTLPKIDERRLLAYFGLKDITHYLEGDIMCKVDRASMFTALESREPFLDQDIIEFALCLDDSFKIRNGKTKYILRQILHKYVPESLFDRPKQGFRVPIGDWLKTIFKEELLDLCNDNSLYDLGLDHSVAADRITKFLSGNKQVSEYEVWFLLSLNRWQQLWNS